MFCCQRLLNNLFVGNQVAAMIEFSRKNNSFSSANDLSFLFSPSFHFQHFLSIYSPFFPFLATPFHSKLLLVPPSLPFPCFPLHPLIPIPLTKDVAPYDPFKFCYLHLSFFISSLISFQNPYSLRPSPFFLLTGLYFPCLVSISYTLFNQTLMPFSSFFPSIFL